MLSIGRQCLKGHRMQLWVMQLWILICWLVPIAAELVARRFLPTTFLWQVIILVSSFICNRALLAPAHAGYYACCRRLAVLHCTDTAATCEIDELQIEKYTAPLLGCFFREYLHPVKALTWQLKWDALRLVSYTVAVFPGVCFLAYGAKQTDTLVQAACGGCGILLCAAVALPLWAVFCRLQTAWYHRPHIKGSKALADAFYQTKRMTGEILLRHVCAWAILPLLYCPLSMWRTALHVEVAAILLNRPHTVRPKRYSQIFHTRVLRET